MKQFVNVAMVLQEHDRELPQHLIEYVRCLEHQLGSKLLKLDGSNMVLTGAGDALAEESLRSLRLAAAAVDAARSRARTSIGTLRIGFAETAMGAGIGRLIRGFNERRPQAPLEIVDFDHQGIIDALESGRIDVGFSMEGKTPITIETRLIETQGFVAVLAPDHPSANQAQLKLSDLPRLRTIEYCSALNGILSEIVGPAVTGGGLGRVKVDGPRNAIRAASAGLGVALLPSGVASIVRHSALQIIPLVPDDLAVNIVAMQRLAESDPLVDDLLQVNQD